MADIESPEDVDLTVQRLPDHQRPYGADCPLDVDIQSVFFHYDLEEEMVELFLEHKFTRLKHFRMANPDGDEKQRQVYNQVTCEIENLLTKQNVHDAFVRLQTDPLSAARGCHRKS